MTTIDRPREAAPAQRDKLLDHPCCIGIPTSEIGRFMMFTISLAGTMQPPGSRIHATASASVVENTNACIREMPEHEKSIWLLGDDHVWPNDALIKMMEAMDEHPEIDILVPLVSRRNPPWSLVIYTVPEGKVDENGIQVIQGIRWADVPATGVFEIEAAGSAGMLIRRDVLDQMADPWFYSTPDSDGRGTIMNEDITFCRRARSMGFRIFATSDVTLGHLGIFNVRPYHKDGSWGALTEFSSSDEQFRHMYMPIAEEAE